MTLRTKFVVVLFMFCLAACINIAGAVYYSNLQFARTTVALEESPTIYKAETVVDSAQRSVHEQDEKLQATFSQRRIEPDQHDVIKVLAHVIRSDAARLGEFARPLRSSKPKVSNRSTPAWSR